MNKFRTILRTLNKLNTESFNNKAKVSSSFLKNNCFSYDRFRLYTVSSEQCTNPGEQPLTVAKEKTVFDPDPELDLSRYGSVLVPTYTFAAYADKSVVIQEFIKLGVKLYKLEKDLSIVKFLIELDYEKNVKPYLLFLYDHGVSADELGTFITKNPLIFKETLNDLEVRINYLKSKRFTNEMISTIITKHPIWLSTPVRVIDKRLGFIQEIFNLKGDHIRKIVTQSPKLATVPKKQIMTNHFVLKEEMGLDEHQVKKLILESPSLLRKNEYDIIRMFEFITKTMKVSRDLVLKQPRILTSKYFVLRERHRYLEILGRAQYNPLLPGYVSLMSLVELTDEEFCEKVAFTSILSYNEFLKTQ